MDAGFFFKHRQDIRIDILTPVINDQFLATHDAAFFCIVETAADKYDTDYYRDHTLNKYFFDFGWSAHFLSNRNFLFFLRRIVYQKQKDKNCHEHNRRQCIDFRLDAFSYLSINFGRKCINTRTLRKMCDNKIIQ